MSKFTYTSHDFLNADAMMAYLGTNLEIHFQLNMEKMNRDEAQECVNNRAALIRVRNILINEAERIANNDPA